MNLEVQQIKDNIINKSLSHVVFDGWTKLSIEKGAQDSGYDLDMVNAVFINGVNDAVEHYSDMIDREMMDVISDNDITDISIRNRIFDAVSARLMIMNRNKEAVKMGLSFWGVSLRGTRGVRVLWNCADKIWIWAGDISTDYNKYTKRIVLSAVIASTMLYWLQDESKDMEKTLSFLKRKINNVVRVGKFFGNIRKKYA